MKAVAVRLRGSCQCCVMEAPGKLLHELVSIRLAAHPIDDWDKYLGGELLIPHSRCATGVVETAEAPVILSFWLAAKAVLVCLAVQGGGPTGKRRVIKCSR